MKNVQTIRQIATFNASPLEVYELFMNQQKHEEFTGAHATISRLINGKFSTYDDYCTGYNIELIEGERIIQAWHFNEVGWPSNHYSVCKFIFEPIGNRTKLNFRQQLVPDSHVRKLKQGWKDYYWEPIKLYLRKQLLK